MLRSLPVKACGLTIPTSHIARLSSYVLGLSDLRETSLDDLIICTDTPTAVSSTSILAFHKSESQLLTI